MSLEPTRPRPAPAFTTDEEGAMIGRPFLVPQYVPHSMARSRGRGPRRPSARRSRLGRRRPPSPRACRRGRSWRRRSDASDGAGGPWLVLVREPDQLGVERKDPQPAFGGRLVELAVPNRHVAADDDRTAAGLDDDHLHAARVARRRDEPEPGKQRELAVDRHVPHAGRLDPLANVVVLPARVLELPALDVDRPAGEEVVAAAVV